MDPAGEAVLELLTMRGALVLLVASGCASLHAPSVAPPRSAPSGEASQTNLAAVEGRPAGAVLRLTTRHPAVHAVELYRVVGDAEPELLQRLDAEGVRDGLRTGLEIVDSTITPGLSYRYQLLAIDAEDALLERSDVVDIEWRSPPPRPAAVEALAPFRDVVEVRWDPARALGAVVFRRDVLADHAPFERVARVAPATSTWVDRSVQPGGVWSYRVALAYEHPSGFVQYGAPSEEVYASTPP